MTDSQTTTYIDSFGFLKKFSPIWIEVFFSSCTLPKTNMDTQNDGLEKVTPFKNGDFWYLC